MRLKGEANGEQQLLLADIVLSGRKLPAMIDTGYQGDLLVPIELAVGLGLEKTGRVREKYAADERAITFMVFNGTIDWLGEAREIEVEAYSPPPAGDDDTQAGVDDTQERRGRRRVPVATVGIGLLNPHTMYVNFIDEEFIIGTDLVLAS